MGADLDIVARIARLTAHAEGIRSESYAPEGFAVALREGVSPGALASSLMPMAAASEELQLSTASRLLAGFTGWYGSVGAFPEELQRAFTDAGGIVAKAYETLQTEESMAATIADWKARSSRPSAAAPVVVVKRRRVAL